MKKASLEQNRKIIKLMVIIGLVVGAMLSPILLTKAGADIPQLLHYQGKLTDSSGNPISGAKNLTFGIYAAASGGTSIWNETHYAVTVTNGLFSVLLGSTTPIPLTTFDNANRYLSVSVDGAELSPRSRFASSAYAFKSVSADSVGSITGDKLANNINITTTGIVTAAAFSGDGSRLTGIAAASGIPPGTIMAFGGATAPAGWLLCDGKAYQTTSPYENLFNVIKYTYGGSGSTFNLPDLRGRTLVGAGTGTGLTAKTLGNTGGEEKHTLTYNEMPSHSHSANSSVAGDHSHTGATDGTATWGTPVGNDTLGFGWGDGFKYYTNVKGGKFLYQQHTHSLTISSGGSHNHPITIFDNGGGGAHENMQPYAVVNYIIKY